MSNKLVENFEKNIKTTKKGKSYVYDPNFIPLHYGNSFDIALDKGACKRFQTKEGTGEFSQYTTPFHLYKRNYKGHKKGERKLIKYEKTRCLYNSLSEAWEAVSNTPEYSLYIQASTGLTHKRRDVIVLDFDANKYFKPLDNGDIFGYRSFEDAESDVNTFIKESGLPKQSYIYYNKKSGNIQVGWFFGNNDTVIYDSVRRQDECRQYLNMGIGLNKLWANFKGMPGDLHFTGWQCKNPFNKNYELREVKFYYNDSSDFDENFNRILSITEPFFPSKKEEISKVTETIETERLECFVEDAFSTYETKESSNKINVDSRNYYEVKYLREWIWQYAREHNNQMPKLSDTKKALYRIEEKANKKLPGKKIKSDKELDAVCKSVLNWSIKKYNKPGSCFYTEEQRQNARLYNYAKMYSNILRMKKCKKTSSRKIAKELGLSKTTICRYRNLSEKDLLKIEILAKQYEINNSENLNQFLSGNNNYNNKYTQKILEIHSLISKNIKKEFKSCQILPKSNYYKRDGTEKEKIGEIVNGFWKNFTEKIQI